MIPGINKGREASAVLQQLEARLAEAGFRGTAPRRAVLEQVVAQSASFTAGELLESVEEASPDVGRATVFRTLDLLVELGLLERVPTETGGTRGHSYILCGLGGTHHHHLVCTCCGRVSDFSGCAVDSLVSSIEAETSFHVEGHRLELYGLCGRCRAG